MKEKLPLGERPPVRIVGKISEDSREKMVELVGRLFGEEHLLDLSKETYDKLKESETEKDQVDRDIIRAANETTNEILTQFGCQPFDIPERNIHILPPQFYIKEHGHPAKKSIGTTIMHMQAVLINEAIKSSPRDYVSTILHEMTHLKGYYSEEVIPGDKEGSYQRRKYRMGFLVFSLSKKDKRLNQKQTSNFRGLNEAIVASIEEEYTDKIFTRIKDSESEASVQGDESEENGLEESYEEQKKVFKFIVGSIAETSGLSEEDIRHLFYKAHFNGNILGVARLVGETFGQEAFRFIGTMDSRDDESAKRVMDYLQKQKRLISK
jgi:hypothetical protein